MAEEDEPVATTHTCFADLAEMELVARVLRRERGSFRYLMTRCNQRLFRAARGLVNSDHEAEDVVQESYVLAYQKLGSFRGDCSMLTWLTQIVINEARQRLRNRKHNVALACVDAEQESGAQIIAFPTRNGPGEDPLAGAARAEMRRFLEQAIDALPEPFRIVYLMREIEECSVEETARILSIKPETVKTRLHRARRMLRSHLEMQAAGSLKDAFQFLGHRCARISDRVLARIGWTDDGTALPA